MIPNDNIPEEELKLISDMSSSDPVVREEAKKKWHEYLEEHPERQIPLYKK